MAITNVITSDGATPIEVAKGRGDLRFSSYPYGGQFPLARWLQQVGGTQLSFARLYAEQPMVAIVVGWLLRQSIRVPLKMYRRTGDDSRDRVREDEHPLAKAIVTPWEGGNQYGLVSSLLGPRLVHGNGLVEIDEGARGAIQFRAADWRFAIPIQPWRDTIAGWKVDTDESGTAREVPTDRMLHCSGFWSPFGPLGVSPLQQLGVTIRIEDALQRHQIAQLKNGARIAGILQASESWTSQDETLILALMNQLREQLDDQFAGPDNSGRPLLTPPGLEWKDAQQTAQEVELINQRLLDRTESGALYGVMPGALGFLQRESSGEAAEHFQISITGGLGPELLLIEAEFNSQVVRRLLRTPEYYVEFDFSGILRGDSLKEIESIREAIATAALTPNEGRSVLNRPKSDQDGMDDFYLPRNNLWPLSVPYPAKGMGGQADTAAAAAAAAVHAAVAAATQTNDSSRDEVDDDALVGA